MGGVVGIAVQGRQQDAAASIGGGVDKLIVAHIDAAVGGGAGGIVVVVEEDQVPGLQLAAVHSGAVAHLVRGPVGQADAELTIDIHGKARAVKACGARAAVYIGGLAHKGPGQGGDSRPGAGGGYGRGGGGRGGGRCICDTL